MALEERMGVRSLYPSLPDSPNFGVYKTIVVDPPWFFERQPKNIKPPYKLMPLEEIKALPVDQLAGQNAHCYLWVPNALIDQGFEVLKAWGFEYKTVLVWLKDGLGTGYYFRNSTELVLFGIKGKRPILRHDLRNWVMASRREHSRKPDEFYELVEKASPEPRIDLFSREKREGWDQWGNQCDFFSPAPNPPKDFEAVPQEQQTNQNEIQTEEIMSEENKRLLKVEEVAQYLGVSPATVYGWVSSQKIPHRKTGRLVRFDLQDVDNWTRKGIYPSTMTP